VPGKSRKRTVRLIPLVSSSDDALGDTQRRAAATGAEAIHPSGLECSGTHHVVHV
jgi:hypothetical protein